MSDVLPVITHPRRNYSFLILGELLWYFALNLYLNFAGLYIRVLGANPVEVGLFYTVFSICGLFAVIIGGPLTARFGEKAVFLLSWGIMVVSPLFYLWAPSWHWTLPAAAIEGISMIASAPLGSYISYLTGGKRSGLAYNAFGAIGGIGGIFGPVFGGWLITQFGYPLMFQLAALIFGISTLFIVPLSSVQRHVEDKKHVWSRDFFSNKVFQFSTVLIGVVIGVYTIAGYFLPLYLYDRFGLIESQIGALTAVLHLTVLLSGPLIGAAADRWGFSGFIALTVACDFTFFGIILFSPTIFFLPVAYAVLGVGSRLSLLLMALFSQYLIPDQLPNAFAVFSFSSRLLTPISPLLGGFGYAINPSFPLVFVIFTAPLPMSLVFLLYRAQKQEKKMHITE